MKYMGMEKGQNRRSVDHLVDLLMIEERARCCCTRAQAQLLIKESDQVKRALWGSAADSGYEHF